MGRRETAFLAALGVAALLLGAGSVHNRSEVFDEVWYMGAGYYLLKTGDFETDSAWWHPPLPLYVNSLPFYILDAAGILPDADTVFKDGCRVNTCYQKHYSYLFMYGQKYRDLNLLFLARCANLLLLPLAAAYLFRLLREGFGFGTSAVVTCLFALNPNVLAHASLATTDFAPACFGLISYHYFRGFLKAGSQASAAKAGFALGLALLAKEVNVYLIPAYLLVAAYESAARLKSGGKSVTLSRVRLAAPRILLQAAALGVVVILVVNAGYLFNGTPSYMFDGFADSEYPAVRWAYDRLSGVPLPISKYMLLSYYVLDVHQRRGHNAYMGGQVYDRGEEPPSLTYWLTVIATKTPEGMLAILALAAAYQIPVILGLRREDTPARNITAHCLIISAVAAAAILAAKANIGVRLILFAYPFAYLATAEPIEYLISRNRRTRTLVYVLAALSVASVILQYPDYIAYFNDVSGGPDNGYRHLSDSNIDWGQDLPGLRDYMRENGIRNVSLAYFGRAWIEGYGIDYTPLMSNWGRYPGMRPPVAGCEPVAGVVAVSVTAMTGQYGTPGCYGWLSAYEPIGNIGHSILVYNITLDGGPPSP